MRIERDQVSEIGALRAIGEVTLGNYVRSNAHSFVHDGSYQFIERVVGSGDIATLAGRLSAFDVVEIIDAKSEKPLVTELAVELDLEKKGFCVRMSSGVTSAQPAISIRRNLTSERSIVFPSWIDRALVNPIAQLVTAILAMALFLAQMIAFFPPLRPKFINTTHERKSLESGAYRPTGSPRRMRKIRK